MLIQGLSNCDKQINMWLQLLASQRNTVLNNNEKVQL